MPRKPRTDFPGAIHHVIARGNNKKVVFKDDIDYMYFLILLADVATLFRWQCHAYCLMPNHFHLLIEVSEANLSSGMQQLNGFYAQEFNKRHLSVGHVFQGRFKSFLVNDDGYFLSLCKYIVLNPVRAGLVTKPDDWPWSNFVTTSSQRTHFSWLNTEFSLKVISDTENKTGDYKRFIQN